MVFRGGFSKGCETCRNRRIKCDEGKPVCARCIKSKRECHGYRDQNDLLFRNENRATAIRASRSAISISSSTPSPPEGRSPPKATPERFKATEASLTTTGCLPLNDEEEEAVTFLFKTFVSVARNSEASRGFLDHLPTLYASARPDSPLLPATVAISLGFRGANRPNRSHLMARARIRYGEALQRLNQAIRDPMRSRANETLLTVLLFGFIESITAEPGSMPHWGVHSDAAISLVKLRGKEMLKDEISTNLLFTVRTQMITNHIYRSLPLDDFFDDNNPDMLSWSDVPEAKRLNPVHWLTNAAMPVPSLRALADEILLQPKMPSLFPRVLGLVQQCKSIDSNLLTWLNSIPPTWQCVSVDGHISVPAGIEGMTFKSYPGVSQYYTYKDIWISSLYNICLTSRAFVQAIILRCGAWWASCAVTELDLNTADIPMLEDCIYAKEVILQVVDDICRSVPYHMGALPGRECNLGKPTRLTPPPLGAYFLVWPLFTAQSVTIAPDEQRVWIRDQLFLLAKRFGINIAGILADRMTGWPMFDQRPLYDTKGLTQERSRFADVQPYVGKMLD